MQRFYEGEPETICRAVRCVFLRCGICNSSDLIPAAFLPFICLWARPFPKPFLGCMHIQFYYREVLVKFYSLWLVYFRTGTEIVDDKISSYYFSTEGVDDKENNSAVTLKT
jgi:hypothetical protein